MRSLPFAFTLALVAACGSVSTIPDGGNNDIDTPAINTCAASNPCDTHATCTDSATGPTCACNAGFTGDGMTCTDINECAASNGGCDMNATCANTVGGRTCTCQPGFLGDGLTCRAVWVQVGALAGVHINPDNFGGLAVGAGSKLFFGPRTNDPTQLTFRSFDVATATFAGPLAMPPETSTDFCACGLTSVFLSNGTNLYLLGNNGDRYDPATNRWVTLAGYTTTFHRGEAAGAFDASNNVLLLIGGRGNEGTAIRMSAMETFGPEAGMLPVGMSFAVAFTPPGNNVTFAAGGDLGQGKALISHATGSGVWTRLTDAPQNLGRPIGMGGFMGELWVARSDGSLFFYNPTTNAWRPQPIQAPVGTAVATMVAGQTYVLAETAAGVVIYRLNAIQ